MVIEAVRISALEGRVKEAIPDRNKLYSIIAPERVKVYGEWESSFITELLNERTVSRWERGKGYLISAQTGTGKSTFIEEVLIPLAQECGKKVLIVVPREALAIQFRKRIGEKFCPELVRQYTFEGIKRKAEWSNCMIITYQSLVSSRARHNLLEEARKFEFVVLDEVHCFMLDALFNVFTQYILEFLITKVAQRSKRVYLSATPEIILDTIAKLEDKMVPDESYWRANEALTVYCFKRHYDYVSIAFGEKKQTILDFLKKIGREEKALIFVRSMNQGEELAEELGSDAVFITAESKQKEQRSTFDKLMETEQFDGRYLIATSWLDVGVNIRDEKLRYIVSFHLWPESVIQMLGRKRSKGKKDRVKLILQLPSKRTVEAKIQELEEENERISILEEGYSGKMVVGPLAEVPFPLYLDGTEGALKYYINVYPKIANNFHIRFLQKLLVYPEDGKFAEHYIVKIVELFPECQGYENMDRVPPVEDQEIIQYLEDAVGKEFTKEEVLDFSDKLLKLLQINRRSDQKDSVPTMILNRAMLTRNIPYEIANLSGEKKKGIWTVRRK